MCIAQDRNQAELIVGLLRRAGYAEDDISVLVPNRSGTGDFAHEHDTKAPVGAVAGVYRPISVPTETSDEQQRAETLFKAAQADDI